MKKLINSLISPNSGKSHRRFISLVIMILFIIMVIGEMFGINLRLEIYGFVVALILGQSYLSTKK